MNCEIEFLPFGEGCKPGDAIVVRYGDANGYDLMVSTARFVPAG